MSQITPNRRASNRAPSGTEEGQTTSSLLALEIEPLDTDGGLLRLHCEPTSHVPVALLDINIDGLVVRLEVLSASHRVQVRHERNQFWELYETVACGSSRSAVLATALPACHRWETMSPGVGAETERVDGWTVEFTSGLERGSMAVSQAATRLRRLDEAVPPGANQRSLVAQFPGHELALTGLYIEPQAADSSTSGNSRLSRCESQTIEWKTWHLYPGSDPHVVWTATSARRLSEDGDQSDFGQSGIGESGTGQSGTGQSGNEHWAPAVMQRQQEIAR